MNSTLSEFYECDRTTPQVFKSFVFHVDPLSLFLCIIILYTYRRPSKVKSWLILCRKTWLTGWRIGLIRSKTEDRLLIVVIWVRPEVETSIFGSGSTRSKNIAGRIERLIFNFGGSAEIKSSIRYGEAEARRTRRAWGATSEIETWIGHVRFIRLAEVETRGLRCGFGASECEWFAFGRTKTLRGPECGNFWN
jgi:hypothetical protein